MSFTDVPLRRHALSLALAGAALFAPGVAEAQRGVPPAPLQVPKCEVQVTGINSGANDVRVQSVHFIQGTQAPAILTGSGMLDIPATNTRVQRNFGRLDPCDAGQVEVLLVEQATPQRTKTVRLAITPQRRTVDVGDVRRFF